MLIFITALQCEAEPIINTYKLKRDMSASGFLLYRGDGVALIISGTGKMNATIAVAFILSRTDIPLNKILLCNWGCCASRPSMHPVGDTFVIQKITDNDTGRDYYPDLPLSLNKTIPQGIIRCVSKPFLASCDTFTGNEPSAPDLFDMESAGIMAAASKFLSAHQILIVKVVSDSGESTRIDPDFLRQTMRQGFIIAAPWIEHAYTHMHVPPPAPETEYDALINQVSATLKLTQSMKRQLRMTVRHSIVSGKNPKQALLTQAKTVPTTKTERKNVFEQLVQNLKT